MISSRNQEIPQLSIPSNNHVHDIESFTSEVRSPSEVNSPQMCYICHEGRNLIEKPCGYCTLYVHYDCLLTHLIANWSMQEEGYSYRNCSICRRRYPNFIINDMFSELDALNPNPQSPVRPVRPVRAVVRNNNINEGRDGVESNCIKYFIIMVQLLVLGLLFYFGIEITTKMFFDDSYKLSMYNSTLFQENTIKINNNIAGTIIIIILLFFLLICKNILKS